MRWEYGHFRFQRSGEVNLTYLNLLSGPQSGFKKELPIYDRLSLSMAVPFAHIRNAISTHYNPFVAADVYKCKWNIDSLGNIRENNGTKMSLSLYTPSDQNLMEEYTISSDAQEIFSNFVDSCRNKGVRVIISWPNIYRNPLYLDHKVPQEKFGQIKEFWASLGLLTLGEPQDYFFDHSFANSSISRLREISKTGCNALGVHHRASIIDARNSLPNQITLQGNLPPELMETDRDTVSKKTKVLLDQMNGDPAHILNLGHGIRPGAKIECMESLVETTRNYSNEH